MKLFAEKGYAAVKVEQIARESGVSLATVYLYFPGKTAIVAGLAEELTAAPDLSVEQVEREPDQVRQARIGARIIRRLNERSWLVADILRSAHGSDENLAAIWARWREGHLEAITRAMRAIDYNGGLREGLTIEEAIDAYYALAGTDVYRALVRERGWTPSHYERWLFELSCREILGIPPRE
jgi:AcrR family transcriptional regulator